jgi:GNAT superfamily N-acetyltransferase
LTQKQASKKELVVPDAPAIPGLRFRGFSGEADFPAIVAIVTGCNEADGLENTMTVEWLAQNYERLPNFDPYRDMLLVEVDGELVGYGRVWWLQEKSRTRRYFQSALLLPPWRGRGIRRTMVRHNEHRLREIATDHPEDGERFLDVWVKEGETGWERVLQSEGYQAVRYRFDMVRPHLAKIPDVPMPEGFEIRPVRPEHHRLLLDALNEAFQDNWGFMEYTEEWLANASLFDPALWQVAWHHDQIVGAALSFIYEKENEAHNRSRGYIEIVGVRPPWRRRGLARALLAHSLRALQAQGMREAGLSTDAQYRHGALWLYESIGFQRVKRTTLRRKPL